MSHIALGMMARAPVVGRCKTRLASAIGNERAVRLYEAMVADSCDAFARAGADRLVVMAAPEDDGVARLRAIAPSSWDIVAQVGEGLGERLAHAFRTLGEDGSSVALVDSDSPTVPMAPVAEALARFSGERRALVGPCVDGGYYLIGLTTLDLGVLRDVPWSTPGVLPTTRARCAELRLALEELPEGYDVDDAASFARLCAELREHPDRAPRSAEICR